MQTANRKSLLVAIAVILTLLLYLLSGLLTATRPDAVGTDTQTYRDYFYISWRYSGGFEFEPLFHHLIALVKIFNFSHEFLFFLVFAIIVSTYHFVFFQFYEPRLRNMRGVSSLLVLGGLLFFSSWLLVSTTNGLRQGIAMPFVYISLHQFFLRRFFHGCVALLVATGFHYSALLLTPFIFLIFMPLTGLYLLTLSLAALYAAGVNERIVKVISDFSGIGIYQKFDDIGGPEALYAGFQLDLFAYSIFWVIFYYILSLIFKHESGNKIRQAFRIYLVLLMPYFVFGYGGYSNRYALYAWFFLPIIHTVFVSHLRLPSAPKLVISLSIYLLGFLQYVAHVTGQTGYAQ